MVVADDRDLLGSLKAYLEELKESGVDELTFSNDPPAVAADVPPQQATPAQPAQQGPAADAAPKAASPSALRQEGNPDSRLWLVMKGSGYAGESGDLLAKMVQAMKFSTSDVCLVTFEDAAPQRNDLLQLITAAGPEVVVAFGEEAARLLLQSAEPIDKLRGRFHKVAAVAVMATLHPAQMVADQSLKRQVWSELQQVMRRLEGYWDH